MSYDIVVHDSGCGEINFLDEMLWQAVRDIVRYKELLDEDPCGHDYYTMKVGLHHSTRQAIRDGHEALRWIQSNDWCLFSFLSVAQILGLDAIPFRSILLRAVGVETCQR